MATHYQRLGVAPSASTEEIRAAYRGLARRLHPDATVDASDAERALAERRMREINEAWAVLGDPTRRRAYDLDRFGSRPPTVPARADRAAVARDPDGELVDVAPTLEGWQATVARHLPWLVVVVVLGVIFVATAYAGGRSGSPTVPAAPAAEGTCVDVAPGPVTTPVDCDGPHDLRIVARVADATTCPEATEARRLATDGLIDCVTPT